MIGGYPHGRKPPYIHVTKNEPFPGFSSNSHLDGRGARRRARRGRVAGDAPVFVPPRTGVDDG